MSWVPTSWWEWQMPEANGQRKRKPGCFARVAIVLVIFVVGSCIWVAIENAAQGQRSYDASVLIGQELDALTPPPTNISRRGRLPARTALFGPTDQADEYDTTLPCQQVQDYYQQTAPDNGWQPDGSIQQGDDTLTSTFHKDVSSFALTLTIDCSITPPANEPGSFGVWIKAS